MDKAYGRRAGSEYRSNGPLVGILRVILKLDSVNQQVSSLVQDQNWPLLLINEGLT